MEKRRRRRRVGWRENTKMKRQKRGKIGRRKMNEGMKEGEQKQRKRCVM